MRTVAFFLALAGSICIGIACGLWSGNTMVGQGIGLGTFWLFGANILSRQEK